MESQTKGNKEERTVGNYWNGVTGHDRVLLSWKMDFVCNAEDSTASSGLSSNSNIESF